MASQAGPVSALAERYATALLELAEERKALDGVAEDLEALKALLEGSPELTHLARSPLIAREDRARAMQAVAERAGFSDLTRNFIGVVARHGRLFALGAIAERFLAVLAERRARSRPKSPWRTRSTTRSAARSKPRLAALRAAGFPSTSGSIPTFSADWSSGSVRGSSTARSAPGCAGSNSP